VSESKIVYIIGAGLNQIINHPWVNGVSPPLINNFFQVALKFKKFSDDYYTKRIQVVYDYIDRYWKKTKHELSFSQFDLEECFALLEMQLNEGYNKQDIDSINKTSEIQYMLKAFFGEVLSEFNYFCLHSETMRQFGSLLLNEKPIIISFNYDEFIEEILESVSWPPSKPPLELLNKIEEADEPISNQVTNGRTEIHTEFPSEGLGEYWFNWVRSLGYGIKFDVVSWNNPS
jgi:hypothetical protein